MATTKYKLKGRTITLKQACELLEAVEGDFAIAIRPKKSGGGFRDDDQIMNMCIANACRTVSTLYVSASLDNVAKDAERIARAAGYIVLDAKIIDSFRKFFQSRDKWLEIAGFVSKSGSTKLFDRMNKALEEALATLYTSGNPSKLDRFCKQWLDMNGCTLDCRKAIDEKSLYQAKVNSTRSNKESKKKRYVTQQAWDKYIEDTKKRWGALGSLFFQTGKQFYPKLRLDSETKKKIGAPVSRKFVRKFYESIKEATANSGDKASIIIEVISRVVEAMPNVRGGLERACKMAAEHWGKKAETALAIKFSGIEI